MEKLFLTVSEASFLLNCSNGYVYNLIHSNKLLAVKRGKYYFIHIDTLKAYAALSVKQLRLQNNK